MKHLISIVILFALVASGCQHPDQVELTPAADDSANQVEITSLASADTASTGLLDSTSIPSALPGDDTRFGATLSIVRSVYDYVKSGRQITVLSFARVLFEDRLQSGPGGIGYFGQHLSGLTLNGVRMDTVRHFVWVPNVGLQQFGVEYVKWLGFLYQELGMYIWKVSLGGMNTASFSIQTPENLVVQSPIGGTRINRSVPLQLQWSGKGNISIIISEYFPALNTVRPILHLKPALNTGQFVLLPRVMSLLPKHQYYVFTFVLNNRKELAATGYSWPILVQASSVYNSFVELY